MKKLSFLLYFCCCSFSVFALDKSDNDTIHSIIEHFTTSWNDYDGKGSANYYTNDADFINIFGMSFSGKDEIESRHRKIHETFLKNSKFAVVDVKLREARPGVVIAQVFWKVSGIKKSEVKPLPETITGVFTHTFIQNNDAWEIASTQNTLITK